VERHPNENPSGIKLDELNTITPSALLAKCEDSGDIQMIQTVLNQLDFETTRLRDAITNRIKRRKIKEQNEPKESEEEEDKEKDKQWKALIAERSKSQNPLDQLWFNTMRSPAVKGLLRDRLRESQGNAEEEIVWRGVAEAYRYLKRMGAVDIKVPVESLKFIQMEIIDVYTKSGGTPGEMCDYVFLMNRPVGALAIPEVARWSPCPDGGYFSSWGLIIMEGSKDNTADLNAMLSFTALHGSR